MSTRCSPIRPGGVSDQDMFARGKRGAGQAGDTGKPFYALLRSLSNRVPYALPKDLPVERVTGYGSLDEHPTAMRYSDWALGQFFEKRRSRRTTGTPFSWWSATMASAAQAAHRDGPAPLQRCRCC